MRSPCSPPVVFPELNHAAIYDNPEGGFLEPLRSASPLSTDFLAGTAGTRELLYALSARRIGPKKTSKIHGTRVRNARHATFDDEVRAQMRRGRMPAAMKQAQMTMTVPIRFQLR